MIIPQAGLPADLLPTVTAFISATPNLGGVLGVGIIGTSTSHPSTLRVHKLIIPYWTDSYQRRVPLAAGRVDRL